MISALIEIRDCHKFLWEKPVAEGLGVREASLEDVVPLNNVRQ